VVGRRVSADGPVNPVRPPIEVGRRVSWSVGRSAYVHPALTTVRLDFEGLGRGCFGLLHRLLEPDTAPALPLWAEPEPIVRENSGPAPSRRNPS
jgi:hypothetical protein